jgi:hypothetical protein
MPIEGRSQRGCRGELKRYLPRQTKRVKLRTKIPCFQLTSVFSVAQSMAGSKKPQGFFCQQYHIMQNAITKMRYLSENLYNNIEHKGRKE